jgi:C-terminal processing protease CtpA/Prc
MKRFLLIVLFASAAIAQRPPDLPITAAERTKVILATADRIERYYFDPSVGKTIAAALRASVDSEAVVHAASALELGPVVNRLLKENGGDRHLRFGYQHEPQTDTGDLPETPQQRADRIRDAQRNGFGIHGVQRLSGNVGLLTWAKFHEPDIAGDAVASAMRLLQSADSLIIDLRNSDGGSPHMVALLVSYFTPPSEDPVLLSTIENRYLGATQQFWTVPYLGAPRYGKQVYILTSSRTFSAGEGFTEAMRRMCGALVVGETTRGGARLSRWFAVHPNFAVSVSVAHHIGATRDWEGVGITPDVAVPEADALQAAHLLALRGLREKAADAETREELDRAIGELEKR